MAVRHSQRLTVRQTASVLGISENAVRSRLKRGTLQSERVEGVVYVLWYGDTQPTDTPPQSATDPDGRDHGQRADHRDELIAVLREQLAAEREANRENRRLLAAALQMRELETSENRSPASTGFNEEEPPADTEGSESPAGERRPWWRRLFGR